MANPTLRSLNTTTPLTCVLGQLVTLFISNPSAGGIINLESGAARLLRVAPIHASRSRGSRTGMSGVVVFRLRSVGFAIQSDVAGIEKLQQRRRRVRVAEEYHEGAFIADLRPEKDVGQGVPPSGAVRVGDRLKRLVREDVIGRVRKLPIRSPRPRRTSHYAREGLDAVKDVSNVFEVGATVIRAKEPGAWLIRRVTHSEG